MAEARTKWEQYSLTPRQLKSLKLPRRVCLLEPWLLEGSITLLYSRTGVGKSFFALEVAGAVAHGRPAFGGLWEPPLTRKARPRVLVVDGELVVHDIIERLGLLGIDSPRLWVTSRCHMEAEEGGPDINLGHPAEREDLQKHIIKQGIKLIIIDNLYSLFVGLDSSSERDWQDVNGWLITLRAKGVSTILIHHAGKSGDQLGTSSRTFNPENVFRLEPIKPAGAGLHFKLCAEKNRGNAQGVDGRVFQMLDGVWTVTEAPPDGGDKRAQIIQLLSKGMMGVAVAKEVGVSKAYVSQVKKVALESGELQVRVNEDTDDDG